MSELLRALAILAEPPTPEAEHLGCLLGLAGEAEESEWTELFVFQLVPYASVYVGAEGMIGGEARDRVAGFWRALALRPPAEPDHLSALVGLYAVLCESERAENDAARRLLRRESRKAFLWEHLLSWLGPYLDRIEEIAPPFYRSWSALLRKALLAEAEELGPPEMLPLHLRVAPQLDPDAEDFLAQLLAPVRAGFILVRADLTRAARELGLGLRLGERRFALEGLVGQDAPAVLAWLAQEARRQGGCGRERTGAIDRFWPKRAESASGLLSRLAQGAREAALVM